MGLESILLASATLSVVALGVGLLCFVSFLPSILLSFWIVVVKFKYIPSSSSLFPSSWWWLMITIALLLAAIVQLIHLRLLWSSTRYLAVFRWIVLPIRKLVIPLVMLVAKLEMVREGVPTHYLHVGDVPGNSGSNNNNKNSNNERDPPNSATATTPLLGGDHQENIIHSPTSSQQQKQHSGKIRRRYRQMQHAFVRDGIRHEAFYSDTTLNLAQVVPILWEHQQRMENKHVWEAFLQRFLVVTVVPNGILDYYYSTGSGETSNELVAFQLSVQQGRVWHWFMYFSKTSATKSGIYFHGILTNLERARRLSDADYCHGHVHQSKSKQNAGFSTAEHTDPDCEVLLSKLYPMSLTRHAPQQVLEVSFWKAEHQGTQ